MANREIWPLPEPEQPESQPQPSTPTEQETKKQSRRRILRYFGQHETQESIREAIFPDLLAWDAELLVEILGSHLDEFLSIRDRHSFRVAAVNWMTRVAKLASFLRTNLDTIFASVRHAEPQCTALSHIVTQIMKRLPDYTGDPSEAAFVPWATDAAINEASALVALATWIETQRKVVLKAIWDVLQGCLDLGVDSGTAEELAADVWKSVAEDATSFTEGPVPIHNRLYKCAYWKARAWKSARLNEREKLISNDDAMIELEALAAEQYGGNRCRPAHVDY